MDRIQSARFTPIHEPARRRSTRTNAAGRRCETARDRRLRGRWFAGHEDLALRARDVLMRGSFITRDALRYFGLLLAELLVVRVDLFVPVSELLGGHRRSPGVRFADCIRHDAF